MLFKDIIRELRRNSSDLVGLLVDAKSERDVLEILSAIINCDRDIKFDSFPVLIVDLVCDNIGIEVEYNKQPHDGIHQAISYKVFLNLDSAVIHVLNYCTREFVNAFRKLLYSLKFLNIKGIIICVDNGEIIAIE